MKLRLNQERDISILDVLEEVSVQNVSVLRAGVSKLLHSGKNKIILNLVDAKHLAMEVIKEIVSLHLIASELKGEILLVGQADMVRQAIKSFATPPPVRCFATKEAALGAFEQEKPRPVISDKPDPFAEYKAQIAKLEAENKSLKGKLEGRNSDETKKLKQEHSQLQQHAKTLEEQLHALIKERKKPFQMDSLETKISQLETALAEALSKEGVNTKGS